jgi:serine O-acetyltransferase
MTIMVPTHAPMRWSLSSDDLARYVEHQLRLFAVPGTNVDAAAIRRHLPAALERVERCFSQIRRKYFFDGERTLFDHRHGDHWAMFLYYLSNCVHRDGGSEDLAASLFLLNKTLHGADLFYGVSLPEVFLLIHPVGTVLGNATYGNYLVAYQNVGVGAVEEGSYPVFEGETVLFARTTVLGESRIGRNVVFGANAFVINTDVPAGSTVVGAYPAHRVISHQTSVVERMFR